MKKITLLILCFMVTGFLLANPITRNEALNLAKSYLQKQKVGRSYTLPENLTLAYECMPKAARSAGISSPLYYIFNKEKGNGFIVVAGDDRIRPILGVTDDGRFDIASSNPNLRYWMQLVESKMSSLMKSKHQERPMIYSHDGLKKEVAPLVKTKWGQDGPYNLLCPVDKHHGKVERSAAGCVAVAMAQALSVFQYPQNARGAVDYMTKTHKFHLKENLANLKFDWDKILPSYSYEGQDNTEEENMAVARLIYACGLATKMDYCSDGSGTLVDNKIMKQFFNIDKSCNLLKRNYFSKAEWDAIIKKELSEGRPVIYGGYSYSGGHSFVCDGYNAEGLFHINWGWFGNDDGYFILTNLDSSIDEVGQPSLGYDGYNLYQDAIIGIQPPQHNTTEEQCLYFYNLKAAKVQTRNDIKVTIDAVFPDGNDFDGKAALGVFDQNNNFINTIGNETDVTCDFEYMYGPITLGGKLPSTIKNGTYFIRPVYRYGTHSYAAMRGVNSVPYVSYLTLEVNGNLAKVSKPAELDANLELVNVSHSEKKIYGGCSYVFKFTIRNNGAIYDNELDFSVTSPDGEKIVYYNNFILEANKETTISVRIETPEGKEEDDINIWYLGNFINGNPAEGTDLKYLGTYHYEMGKPAPGEPKLKVLDYSISPEMICKNEPVNIHLKLTNEGGFFNKPTLAIAYNAYTGKYCKDINYPIYINKGDTIEYDMSMNFSDFPCDLYGIFPRYYNNNTWNDIIDDWHIFEKRDAREITIDNSEGYAALSEAHAWQVPEGAQCGIVNGIKNGLLAIDYRYQAGDIVPAYTPVVFKSQPGSQSYEMVTDNSPAPKNNLLFYRIDQDYNTYVGEGDYQYYRFGTDDQKKNCGFYLNETSGKPFELQKPMCYFALPRSSENAQAYLFNNSISGIENVYDQKTTASDAPVYTLSGVRVNAKTDKLPKGIYIVNGKKLMIK